MSADVVIFRYTSVGFSFEVYADRLEILDAAPQSAFRRQGGRGTIPFNTIRDVTLDGRTHTLQVVTDDTRHSFVLGNQASQAHFFVNAARVRYAERHRTVSRPRRLPRLAFVFVAVVLLLAIAVVGFVAASSGIFGGKATPPLTSCVGQLCVLYIDAGQADSILLQSPDGKTALIDGGNPDGKALAYIRQIGIARVDLMFLTHPHRDHVGGLTDVLNALPVGQVITTGSTSTTSDYTTFLTAIDRRKVPYREVKRGESIAFGTLNFSVLNAVRTANEEELNDSSLVLKLQDKGVSFLFTGDAEMAAESTMLRNMRDQLPATILKVGHHGANDSSSPSFLAAVRPSVAIYSAGQGNNYGHPAPSTIANLKAAGAKVFGTDINGTVVVMTDGVQYCLTMQKQAAPFCARQ